MEDNEAKAQESYPFVFIEWMDARSTDEWLLPSQVEAKPAVIRSVGWIVVESEEAIAITGNWAPELNNFCLVMMIPKVCIRKRIDLIWPDEIGDQ